MDENKAIDVFTENNSIYRLEETGWWAKIKILDSGFYSVRFVEALYHTLMVGDYLQVPAHDWSLWTKSDRPVIGKHMFIRNNDRWQVTTKVVDIQDSYWMKGIEQ